MSEQSYLIRLTKSQLKAIHESLVHTQTVDYEYLSDPPPKEDLDFLVAVTDVNSNTRMSVILPGENINDWTI